MNDSYYCTAGDLATPNPESIARETTVGDAVEWFAARGYDVAPVVENDVPIGYTEHEQLKEFSDDELVGDHCDEITIDEILDSETAFSDLLVALYESEFYFLGGRNRLAGIVTRADINKTPTYMHLYAELSTLEQLFRRLILEKAPAWKDQVRLHPEKLSESNDGTGRPRKQISNWTRSSTPSSRRRSKSSDPSKHVGKPAASRRKMKQI